MQSSNGMAWHDRYYMHFPYRVRFQRSRPFGIIMYIQTKRWHNLHTGTSVSNWWDHQDESWFSYIITCGITTIWKPFTKSTRQRDTQASSTVWIKVFSVKLHYRPKAHRTTITTAHDAFLAYFFSQLCCLDLLIHHIGPQQPLNSDIIDHIVSFILRAFITAYCLHPPH